MKKGDSIVVIAERVNPQLGTYYIGPFFAKVRTFSEKTGNFSIRYLNELDSFRPTKYNYLCHSRENGESVYGSCSYCAYTIEQALHYFQNVIDSHEGLNAAPNAEKIAAKFKEFLKKIEEFKVNNP